MMAQIVVTQSKPDVKSLSTAEVVAAKLAARQKLSFPKK
jgi:hypothetical protein